MKNHVFLIVAAVGLYLCLPWSSMAQTPFDQGLKEFREENYEEALEYFKKARQADPESTRVAFYLGLTYKQMEYYEEAVPCLREAVTKTPKISEALIELIDALIQTDKTKEAEEWIAVGEKEGVQPARLQFLKGQVYAKESRFDEAIEAFNKAKNIDPSLTQIADFQAANALMREGRLKEAQSRLRAASLLNPNSDIGVFAKEYERLLTEKMERERVWRFRVGLGYKYDTNVVAMPSSGPIADAVSGQRDSAFTGVAQVSFTAPFSYRKPYNLSILYSVLADRYFNKRYTRADGTTGNLTEFNQMINLVTLTPGYNFSKVSLSLPMSFTYSWLQGEKGSDFLGNLHWFGDTKYMHQEAANPTARFMLSQNNLGEASFGLAKKTYFDHPVDPAEDRDSTVTSGTVGWTYFFKQGQGLVGVRYTYADENADGANWSNVDQRLAANLVYPLVKRLKLQVSGEGALTRYDRRRPTINQGDLRRKDDTIIASSGLVFELLKNIDVIGQYTYIRDKSNINVYDYRREVFSLSVEYRY